MSKKKSLRDKAINSYFTGDNYYDGEFENFIPIEYVGYCLHMPGYKNIKDRIKFLKQMAKKLYKTIGIFENILEEDKKEKHAKKN